MVSKKMHERSVIVVMALIVTLGLVIGVFMAFTAEYVVNTRFAIRKDE